jgi:hypothetical protein
LLDVSLTILSVNTRAKELLGDGLHRKNIIPFLCPSETEELRLKEFGASIEAALHGLQSPSFEKTVKLKNASGDRVLNVIVTALNINGEIQIKPTNFERISMFILTLQDCTKSVLDQELLKKERDRTQRFLSTIIPKRLLKKRLKGEHNTAKSVPEACILSVDFSNLEVSREWFSLMERIRRDFDNVLKKYWDLTHINSLGNSYMAVGGLSDGICEKYIRDAVTAGLEMMSLLELLNSETLSSIELTIVVTVVGPVSAGVVELGCPIFQVYGIPFNEIELLRQVAVPWRIVIPKSVYDSIYGQGFSIKEGKMIEGAGAKAKTYLVRKDIF